MDMVRWILGPKCVLDTTICIMNFMMMVRCTLGPVGANYYHMICCNYILHNPLSLL
jgi:hypothetical protein